MTELSKKVDVYDFGIVLLELLTRKKLWRDESDSALSVKEISARVVRGERPTIPEFLQDQHSSLTKIIQQCWRQDPLNRPSFDEIPKSLGKQAE